MHKSKKVEASVSELAFILDAAKIDIAAVQAIAEAFGKRLAPHCNEESAALKHRLLAVYQEYYEWPAKASERAQR